MLLMNDRAMAFPKDFLQLQITWYKKLREKGFDDIEYKNGDLKQVHSRTKKRALEDQAKREAYYDAAWDFYHKSTFENVREKTIWGYHCDGATVRWIAEKMQMHPATVHWNIKQIRKRAKITK